MKVGIVNCSNGQKRAYAEKIRQLEETLVDVGIQPVFSECIYEKEAVFSGSAEDRAATLMQFYGDDEVEEIFDISGGDVANEVLPYLDYDDKKQQIQNFRNTVLEKGTDLFQFEYRFLQQKEMRGIVVGGNIRCFLKLAGTEYMPDLTGKILLLESYGGTVAQIETYLCQLQQLGAFDKVAGILFSRITPQLNLTEAL